MQVGLTRDELLELVAIKADALSSGIRRSSVAISGEISNAEVDEISSRISALVGELFRSPPNFSTGAQQGSGKI